MKKLATLLLILCVSNAAWAAIPALSGRVVDQANILSPESEANLTGALEQLERNNGDQLVVVTVASLDGQPIEDYGVTLGRVWGIGQKDKNNGALFIVAPNDRQVRIEVGYGLEGVLTDAESSRIIQQVILPDFRAGQLEQGVIHGTAAIIQTLGGEIDPSMAPPERAQSETPPSWVITMMVIIFIIYFIMLIYNVRHGYPIYYTSGRMRSGGSGFGGGFGGFSGGGGSFGGGGASGRW